MGWLVREVETLKNVQNGHGGVGWPSGSLDDVFEVCAISEVTEISKSTPWDGFGCWRNRKLEKMNICQFEKIG